MIKPRHNHRARHAAGLFDELVVDSFAGGGGASLGIERALGRAVDVAINHDRDAVAMHTRNHPRTRHYCEDVWHVDPAEATGGRPVGMAWFSPDCKHFSRAKGGKPVEKKIRGLAWVVVRWAKRVRPRVIFLENVREFATWGPLGPDDRPCPDRRGLTFRRWVGTLRNLGYAVEWRELNAADYGAPTFRKRLFLVARCDGLPVAWPEPTHGRGRTAYRTAASCLDWSLPCPSIFLTPEEARPIGCRRPLAEKTQRRIAMGLKRFVIDSPKPFIVNCNHGGDHFRGQTVDRPISTLTGRHGYGLVSPFLASYYGEHTHQETRGQRADEPARTVTPANRFGLVMAFLSKHYGGVVGHGPDRPIGTVTAVDHHSVAAAHLIKMNFGEKQWMPADEPLRTVLAGANHHGLVTAFLAKYYGTRSVGQSPGEPIHTLTGNVHFGLVTVRGEPHLIADIGLRMLRPRELYRCQGFPDDYEIEVRVDGRPLSKEAQTRMVGNSVCPDVAEAVVRANVAAGAGWEVAS